MPDFTAATQPKAIPVPSPAYSPNRISLPKPAQAVRIPQLTLDTFSPVTQNGSFEFDRIIKSGEVNKRTRKTKVG